MRAPKLNVPCKFVIKAWSDTDKEIVMKSFQKCGIWTASDGTEDDLLWEENEDNEDEVNATNASSDSEIDLYDESFTNVPQDVLQELFNADDEDLPFEEF